MADKGFNGSTLVFNSVTQGSIRNITFSEGGTTVDVTSLDDTQHKFLAGKSDVSCTITIVGNTTIPRGSHGALTVNWNDGTSDTISDALLSELNTSGAMDGEITTDLTFVPYGG